MNQFIYIASSPSMPGVVKIGKTYQAPGERIKEVAPSGVQKTFDREFCALVDDAGTSEARLRVNLSRSGFAVGTGLFRISVKEAIKITMSLIDDLKVHSYRHDDKIESLINGLLLERQSRASVEATSEGKKSRDRLQDDHSRQTERHTNANLHSPREQSVSEELKPKSLEINSGEFIYILSNPSMPGYVKVGRTNTTLEQRSSELYSTGVPTRFELELGLEVESSVESERKAHSALSKFRPERNREFFKIPVKRAIEIVLFALEDYKILEFRENYGVERLIDESLSRRQEAKERRKKEINLIMSELAQIEPQVTKLEASLRHEEDIYKSFGTYPTNSFGGFFAAATFLSPVIVIAAGSSGGNVEGILLFVVLALACMYAANAHLEKEVDEKAIPFNQSQQRIDAIKKDLHPLQKRLKELKEAVNRLA